MIQGSNWLKNYQGLNKIKRMGNPTQTQPWKNLKNLALDGGQGELTNPILSAANIKIDVSYGGISDKVWGELCALLKEQQVEQWRDKMVAGQPINITEKRAVGHMWLRDGKHPDALNVLKKIQAFCDKTHTENKFTDIVHIGIGGSDLGPRFVCDALKHLPKHMNVHFVANVDAADITETLKPLNPATTLFVIASKTFTTIETMMNAKFAKAWLGGRDIAKHMIALSTNEAGVKEFGINPDNMFPFWDWVGGRFSVWSSIGMPIALAYGFDVFQDFLDGAKAMDDHFKTAEPHLNLPMMLALYGVWNRNFMGRSAVAVLPYTQNFCLFPNLLQQIDMESNGKHVTRDGDFITDYATGPIVFGQAGTNGQHAFHQWLHQGTDIVPCEIIAIEQSPYDSEHHRVLNANAAAQTLAFFKGDDAQENLHKHYAGKRPSVKIELKNLTPSPIGAIIALYEHKIFVQGIIWNINSFDQYGVELGKKLATRILET